MNEIDSMAVQKQPRPYVKFEMRAQEDRTKKSADGVSCMVDVAWVIVRAPGSKDSLEKPAEEWFFNLDRYAADGRIPKEWPSQYRAAFKEWQAGQEMPVFGTPIKSWPPLTPSQRSSVLQAGIYTVEDLAQANDETRARIGMGSLQVIQIARTWLEEAKSKGTIAKSLEEALVKLEEARNQLTESREQNQMLQARIEELEK